MAIDPNIALGVRPIEIANPLAQYGQIAQLQNMQTQNQLHQMQMREAEATAQERNALRQLNPSAPDYEQQLFKVNPQLGIAFRKEASTAAAQEAARQKSLIEAAAAKQGMMSQAYRDISSRPSDANIMAHTEDIQASPLFSEAEKQKALATQQTLLAMPLAERGAYLASQGAKSSELKPNVNVGPTGIVQTPAFGGAATVVPGTEAAFQMTPGQIAANKIAQQRANIEQQRLAQDATSVVYQTDANGNVVALPSKLRAGEVPTGRTAVAPGGGFQPMMAKPSEAEGKEQMSINQQRSIVQGAIDAVKSTPDAFGFVAGNMPESARARLASSDENEARAFVFNVVSGVIKERAGTAQSAGEAATLARFLPAEGDNAKIIEDKLSGFQKYLTAKESGTTKKRSGGNAPAAVTNPQFPGFSIGKP